MDIFANCLAARLEDKQSYIQKFNEAILCKNADPRIGFQNMHGVLKFEPHTRHMRPSIHLGQRKLFLNELKFLSEHNLLLEDTWVIYAGSAPGQHIPSLYRLFPKLKMVLVDPRAHEFRLNSNMKVRSVQDSSYIVDLMSEGTCNCIIYKGLFDNWIASHFENLGVLFMSDIRTNDEGDYPSDAHILWNYAMQYQWVTIMNPIACMLKFRYVYFNGLSPNEEQTAALESFDPDFKSHYEQKSMLYLDGDIWTQAFAGPSSSECRLVCKRPYDLKIYDNQHDFEQKYFYYNLIDRPFVMHRNPNSCYQIGFDNCGDCSIENAIWEIYSSLVRPVDIKAEVNRLSCELRQPLLQGPHGYLTRSLSFNIVKYMAKKETLEHFLLRHVPIDEDPGPAPSGIRCYYFT